MSYLNRLPQENNKIKDVHELAEKKDSWVHGSIWDSNKKQMLFPSYNNKENSKHIIFLINGLLMVWEDSFLEKCVNWKKKKKSTT